MKTEHAIDWRKTAAEIQDDYERVCKERDEYKQDALRYRWLRNGGDDDICVGIYDSVIGDFCFTTWDSELDETIDKAMEQTK